MLQHGPVRWMLKTVHGTATAAMTGSSGTHWLKRHTLAQLQAPGHSRVACVLHADSQEVHGPPSEAVRQDGEPEAGPAVRLDGGQALQHEAARGHAGVAAGELRCEAR